MGTMKIDIQIDDATMDKLNKIIRHAQCNFSEDGRPQSAFLLQVYDDGHARGLALSKVDIDTLDPIIQQIYANAKPFIQHA